MHVAGFLMRWLIRSIYEIIQKLIYTSLVKAKFLIALSHIHVPAAYRSRIYEKTSICRGLSRILFKGRMYHVRMTFLLRNRGVSVMRSMSYASRSMSYVCSRMYDVRVMYLSYLDTP